MTSTDSFFDALKQHRESQNIEIAEICEFTKINPKYIQAIEEGDFQALPIVYMRLFLRAYSEFIGADSRKALVDFELYTTGKIRSAPEIDLKPKSPESPISSSDLEMASAAQITPRQIATGAGVLIGLFLILYWAGEITSQQSSEVENNTVPVVKTVPESIPVQEPETIPENKTNLEGTEEKKSPVIDKPAVAETAPLVASIGSATNLLPNKLPLNSNDFLPENKHRETTSIVKLFAPYTISIITLQETKLNISKSNNGNLTELINQVSPSGTEFQFDFESTINFEFWSNAHIEVKLNEIPLDNFLSDDGLSVRGSYEADKSQLYLGFYRH